MSLLKVQQDSPSQQVLLFGLFVLLSVYVTYEHFISCIGVGMEIQLERHARFIAGDSEFFNPWQYRVFSGFVLEGFIKIFDMLPLNLHPYTPYLALKFLQILLILYAAFYFYRALNINSISLLLMGLMVLAFNMSNSNWQADMAFNTYFDILFYLIAGYVILRENPVWIVPLTAVAALNRETSGFIPIMLIISAFDYNPIKLVHRKRLWYGLLALVVFFVLFMGIRMVYGLRPYEAIHDIDTPLEFFMFNIRFFNMYPQLIGTFGIIPIIALIGWKRWPFYLKAIGLLIVPFWVIIHLFKSMAMETRLFLVPQALIFIPAVLYLVEWEIKVVFQKKVE